MSDQIKGLFSPQEIRQLTAKSNWRGTAALLKTLLSIGLCFTLLIQFPHPLMWLLVVVLLGGQQLACAIMTHEGAHRSLFKTAKLNRYVVDFLCARLVWLDVERYRKHHIAHHAHTGTERDPDNSLVDPYPTSKSSLARKMLRDLVGITGFKRVLGLVLMDVGAMKYTVSGDVHWLPKEARSWQRYCTQGLQNIGPVLVANLLLYGVLAACGAGWAYWAWPLAYLTTFSLFIRIRSIAEHACMPGGESMFNNTRTTQAGWLARMTVAPMHVNYHQEHHLMASVPYYRLPQMHKMLRERRAAEVVPSYRDVLALAGSVEAAT